MNDLSFFLWFSVLMTFIYACVLIAFSAAPAREPVTISASATRRRKRRRALAVAQAKSSALSNSEHHRT